MMARYFFGIAARQVISLHLRCIAFVMFILLTVAIAIDLAKHLDTVRSHADETNAVFISVLVEYLGYRTVDIVTRLLPMASLAGAFVAELLRHQRLENVILSAAGIGPGLVYSALLVVGLVIGLAQAGLEGWLRPAAIWAQVDFGIGSYAKRFERGERGPEWFTDQTRAIRATVVRGKKPELRNLMVFEGIDQEALTAISYAARAVPGDKPQDWVLFDVVQWQGAPGSPMTPKRLERLDVSFPLLPVHVEYHNVLGFYLPNDALHDVASFRESDRWADAETAVARRYLAVFLPGVFALLGASLSQAGLSGRLIAWWRLLPLGVLGYVTLVSVKSFWALGEFGALTPWASASAPLLFAFLLACILQIILTLGRLPGQRRLQAS